MRLSLLVVLSACGVSGTLEQPTDGQDLLIERPADETLPPPTFITIAAPDYATVRSEFAIDVGEALEGERVFLVQGSGFVDEGGPCPLPLGGYCLDMPRPIGFAGAGTAEADGVATIRLTAPPFPGAVNCYQAVIPRGIAGLNSAISDVACVDFCADVDSDGDGRCDAFDLCIGDDDVDTDGDGICDSGDTCPGGPDGVDTDSDGVCDTLDICPGFPDDVDSDGDGTPDGCESEATVFEFTYPDAGDTCPQWNDWRAALPTSGLTGMRMYGTFDVAGIECNDPSVAQGLADAIRTNSSYLGFCDGHDWSVCDRYTGEVWIDPPSLCSGSNCPDPGYIYRACIGGYPVPGGVNSGTCSNIPQMMGLEFF